MSRLSMVGPQCGPRICPRKCVIVGRIRRSVLSYCTLHEDYRGPFADYVLLPLSSSSLSVIGGRQKAYQCISAPCWIQIYGVNNHILITTGSWYHEDFGYYLKNSNKSELWIMVTLVSYIWKKTTTLNAFRRELPLPWSLYVIAPSIAFHPQHNWGQPLLSW